MFARYAKLNKDSLRDRALCKQECCFFAFFTWKKICFVYYVCKWFFEIWESAKESEHGAWTIDFLLFLFYSIKTFPKQWNPRWNALYVSRKYAHFIFFFFFFSIIFAKRCEEIENKRLWIVQFSYWNWSEAHISYDFCIILNHRFCLKKRIKYTQRKGIYGAKCMESKWAQGLKKELSARKE